MPITPTLTQKTRGTQSSANTYTNTRTLATTEESNCLKQTTEGQGGVLPEEVMPFVDLTNHADLPLSDKTKTGFKNWFTQASLDLFFGFDSVLSTFKAGAGKIRASFLDQSWVATLLTNSSVIDQTLQTKFKRNWYSLFPMSVGGSVVSNTSQFSISTDNIVGFSASNYAIPLPTYTTGSKFILYFDFLFSLALSHPTQTPDQIGGVVNIRPWIRKQFGATLNPAKTYLVNIAPYNTNTTYHGRMETRDAVRYYDSTSPISYILEKQFSDIEFTIDTAVDVGITRIDFGFDIGWTNGSGTWTTVSTKILRMNNMALERNCAVEIFRA